MIFRGDRLISDAVRDPAFRFLDPTKARRLQQAARQFMIDGIGARGRSVATGIRSSKLGGYQLISAEVGENTVVAVVQNAPRNAHLVVESMARQLPR